MFEDRVKRDVIVSESCNSYTVSNGRYIFFIFNNNSNHNASSRHIIMNSYGYKAILSMGSLNNKIKGVLFSHGVVDRQTRYTYGNNRRVI